MAIYTVPSKSPCGPKENADCRRSDPGGARAALVRSASPGWEPRLLTTPAALAQRSAGRWSEGSERSSSYVESWSAV